MYCTNYCIKVAGLLCQKNNRNVYCGVAVKNGVIDPKGLFTKIAKTVLSFFHISIHS